MPGQTAGVPNSSGFANLQVVSNEKTNVYEKSNG